MAEPSSRRQFLGTLAAPALLPAPFLRSDALPEILRTSQALTGTPEEVAQDEDYWNEIARAYTVDRSAINFNNGGVSPAPAFVQEAMVRHLSLSNDAPARNMWHVLEPRKETIRDRMARDWCCDPEELAITRNASEGLQILQFGFDLQPGDEVLCTTQDYPRMLSTFKQRAAREGIVLKQFSIPTPAEDPSEVVELYRQNITDRTKMILVCHVINLTGQVLPVTEITALGRSRGIPVIVDGAHSFAQIDFTFEDLQVDYFATSLHKWLCAPIGTGLLYVRRDKIEGVWPLMAGNPGQEGDIRKFEEIGTHPAANILGIAEALTFHQGIGPARRQARLRYLRDRWAKRLAQHERTHLNSSLEPDTGSGFANVQIVGVDTVKLAQHLWREHKIIVTAIVHEEFQGLRVTPNVYSTIEEVDRFAEAMEAVLENGLPS